MAKLRIPVIYACIKAAGNGETLFVCYWAQIVYKEDSPIVKRSSFKLIQVQNRHNIACL